MTNQRQKEISRSYRSLMEAIVEVGQVECQTIPEFFFPTGNNMTMENEVIKIAKEICTACPVKIKCAAYALTADEPFGIYGALTPEERRYLKRAISLHDDELEAKQQQSKFQ